MGERTENSRRALLKEDLLRMNIPRRFWKTTLDEVTDFAENGEPSLRDFVCRYLSRIEEMLDRGAGLLLWGHNGCGKTGAAVVIAKEARRRERSVLFVTAAELRTAVLNQLSFDNESTMVQRAKDVDVLVIDDLGKDHLGPKGFGERFFEEMVRHRSAGLRTTLLTTNVAPVNLAQVYLPSMLEVMKECIIPVEVLGPDRRIEAQQELQSLIEKSA